MSNPGESDPTPITSARQLAGWFAAGSKARSDWRIGTEHEKFGFRRTDFSPPAYGPADDSQGGIRALLEGMQALGWAPILDSGNPIGLKREGAAISLEPGDIIATGTPAGVGIGFDPPKYLKPGDVVRVEIDGIGTLENRFAEAV